MAIVLVRHGDTEWSESRRHTSHTDLPLTDRGREQASLLAGPIAAWSFARVLCSPLLRARQTCELAGLGDRAELLDDLREWDYGEYEGVTTVEIRAERPEWVLWRDGCPGGERPEQVGERADHALAVLHDPDGDTIAFAHGHFLRVLAARWIGLAPAGGARLALSPGTISVLGHEHENEVISLWNRPPET